jgi:tRNA1Val (adenine37-N6)-methyltransferase
VKLHGETINGLLRNKIRVIQARHGYRVSEDAVILSWFTKPGAGELILDAGAGCGVIAFAIATMRPSTEVIGLELQEALADRAARGVRLNGLENQALIVRGDLRRADTFFKHQTFDAVVSNPPYYEPGRGRINLHEEKALSRHQMMMPLEDLFRVASLLLKPQGRLSLIYPASGTARIKKAMSKSGFEASRVLWIHPHEGAEPGLVCVEAKTGTHDVVECRLCLYETPGKRTRVADAILSGENADLACASVQGLWT